MVSTSVFPVVDLCLADRVALHTAAAAIFEPLRRTTKRDPQVRTAGIRAVLATVHTHPAIGPKRGATTTWF